MIAPSQLENIKIFLTDQARGRPAGRVTNLSLQIMLAVADFYNAPGKANGFRQTYGLTSRHTAGWDSGGFQFLMGKMKGVPMETLPCGIQVPVSAKATVDLYKRVGSQPGDLPIQLDLPPRYDLEPASRRQLIERSARYYWEMTDQMPVVPCVHGWTLEEIEYSLSMIEDRDEVATGSNLPAGNDWTMGNMNSHKGKVASGSFFIPEKSVVDFVHPSRTRTLAMGSFKAETNSVDYLSYMDNQANPLRNTKYLSQGQVIATPFPTVVDVGIVQPDKTVVVSSARRDRVVATPIPSAADVGLNNNILTNNALKRKTVAVGSFQALQTGPISEKRKIVASGTQAVGMVVGKKKRVPYSVILDRIAMVLNRLREDYDVFMLGGASPHMQHQIFLSGAKWTDTSAWRIKALIAEIYFPERGERSIGYSHKTRRMDDDDAKILRDCLTDPTHPFSGMSMDRFLEIGRMVMPEWYETFPKNRWEVTPFVLRALHNAWVLKFREEPIANEYVADPDRYYKYLQRRLKDRPILSRRLRELWERIKRPYVQYDLGVYLKGRT